VTRAYFGSSSDIAVPLQFNPSSACEIGIFRGSSGLWAVKGVTRVYFGQGGGIPVPGDYDGDGTKEIGLYCESSGLWALKGVSRLYFGGIAIGRSLVTTQVTGPGRPGYSDHRPACGR